MAKRGRPRQDSGKVLDAFGKHVSELDAVEWKLYRQAARIASHYRHHTENKRALRNTARLRKVRILTELGWVARCMRCGYDNYIGALDFHHIDPHTKDREVQSVEEARKCQLLCSNCHREVHAEARAAGATTGGGRPCREDLDPRVLAYLTLCGVTHPSQLDSVDHTVLAAEYEQEIVHDACLDDVPR